MIQNNMQQHDPRLSAVVMLGCFTLLMVILILGMYALTFIIEAKVVMAVRAIFLCAGILGLAGTWKIFRSHIAAVHSKHAPAQQHRPLHRNGDTRNNMMTVFFNLGKHAYDQFKRTTQSITGK